MRLRAAASTVLIVLTAILAAASVAGRYVHSELLDTPGYIRIVAPLGSDPVLREHLADRITDAVLDRLDVTSVATQTLTAVAANMPRVPQAITGLAPLFTAQARELTRSTTESFLASDAFGALWIQANEQAHREVVAVLRGATPAAVGMDPDGTVRVDLGPITDRVRTELLRRGLPVADKIPTVTSSFVLFRSPDLVTAQRWVRILDPVAVALPWVTLLVALGAIAVAPRGRRSQACAGLGGAVALSAMLCTVGIGLARSHYLQQVPADVLSQPVAAVVVDAFLRPCYALLRTVFVLSVLVALAGWVAGGSRYATAIRDAARRMLRSDGVEPSRFAAAVARSRIPLHTGIIAVAAATLVFWPQPTGLVDALVLVIAACCLLAVETTRLLGTTRTTQ